MMRIGFGFDIHQIVKKESKKPVKLFSVLVSTEFTIVAVSDGDVALHSLANAILGALGDDDIGTFFPPQITKNNYDSRKILEFALKKLAESSFKLGNIDITLVCDVINFVVWKKQFKQQLSLLLGVRKSLISIKATTSEGAQRNYLSCYTSLLITE